MKVKVTLDLLINEELLINAELLIVKTKIMYILAGFKRK